MLLPGMSVEQQFECTNRGGVRRGGYKNIISLWLARDHELVLLEAMKLGTDKYNNCVIKRSVKDQPQPILIYSTLVSRREII